MMWRAMLWPCSPRLIRAFRAETSDTLEPPK